MTNFSKILPNLYDSMHILWHRDSTRKYTSNIVLLFFVGGVTITLLNKFGVLNLLSSNTYFGIELAFNAMLVIEVCGLIFVFTKSIADSVGKQFEIISLILLRDAFKEFGYLPNTLSWDQSMIDTMYPVLFDAFGALIVFFITGLFYQAQKHTRITENDQQQDEFVNVKKIVALVLLFVFIILGIRDFVLAYQNMKYVSSFKLFYTILIFTDIFILIFSLRYSSRYVNLFRYSSFALATITLRLSLSVPKFINVVFAVMAGVFVLLSTYVYNYLNKTKVSN